MKLFILSEIFQNSVPFMFLLPWTGAFDSRQVYTFFLRAAGPRKHIYLVLSKIHHLSVSDTAKFEKKFP